MKVRLPVDPDRRNFAGAVSTSEITPGFDRTKGQVLTTALRSGSIDPYTWELVRWRNARRQDCQLCQAHRDADAREAGVTEETLVAVDDYESSDLSDKHKAVLRFTDAYLGDPSAVPEDVVRQLQAYYSPEQRVELLLLLFGTTQNRVLRTLGLDQGPPPA